MIGYDELVFMLRGAADKIKSNREALCKLDSNGGDGDHGVSMHRAMKNLEEAIDGCSSRALDELLAAVGRAILAVDGGATGPLFGSLFRGMAQPVKGHDSLDSLGLAAMFEAGLAGVQKRTKAQVGDKTMIDALAPAVEAVRREAERGSDVAACLSAAADAAEAGACSTKELQARFGRAKNVGEKSVGYPDPGATSVSLMFKGFQEGV